MTIDEMRKQKERLEKDIKAAEEAEKINKQNAVSDKLSKISSEEKEIILKYMNHDRMSCSDNCVANGFGSADYGARCRKCHLIEVLNGEWGGRFDFSLDVTVWEVE